MSSRWHLNLDRRSFLADYWQRKPLFIPGAIDDFVPPIAADELAGLALEPEVESRLIEQVGDQWRLLHGPFTAPDFHRTTNWTLLVQAVDHFSDAVADLRRLIDFIPQWRIDDVMVSYATDGGSVGPHYDNYDVFLLQGEGQRRWLLGQQCDGDSALLAHADLRILAQFEQTREYLLNPGDILYVPPGVAHWGIAQGDCTTFSIGFRAPRISDLLSRRVDQLLESLDSDTFYVDAGRTASGRPGEILQADIERAYNTLQQAMQVPTPDNWFGELVTEPKTPLPGESVEALAQLFAVALERGHIDLAPECKLAWQESSRGITVYANGTALACTPEAQPVLLQLCADWRLDASALRQALAQAGPQQLLEALAEQGCLYVRD